MFEIEFTVEIMNNDRSQTNKRTECVRVCLSYNGSDINNRNLKGEKFECCQIKRL